MRVYLIFLVAFVLFAAAARAQSFEERQAAGLVEDMASEVFTAVRGGSEGQRASRLVPVIQRYVEIDAVAQDVLGPIWNELTPSQRSDFARIYVGMIAGQYAVVLDGRGGGRFQLKDTFKLAGGQVRVRGNVTVAGETVPVGFIVGSGFQPGVRNIILNDVALVEQDRQMFAATWEAAGGDYSSFADALRDGFQ